MKRVVSLLIIILLCSPVSALWNGTSSAVCGNNAVEFGEECDSLGKECYTKSFQEGRCTSSCNCEVYTGPVCGNDFVDDDEDCEEDADCGLFEYCDDCKCIAKVASAQDLTDEDDKNNVADEDTESNLSSDQKISDDIDSIDEELDEISAGMNDTEFEEFTVNESFFEAEKFNETLGIKITGAITKVTKKLFGSLFGLIKGWFT
jgi:hypothetical protein